MNERSIGMRLSEALTKEQIVHLLDTAYGLWGKAGMKELIAAVDEDVASTLSRLLDPKAPPRERIVSDDKLMEEWGELGRNGRRSSLSWAQKRARMSTRSTIGRNRTSRRTLSLTISTRWRRRCSPS